MWIIEVKKTQISLLPHWAGSEPAPSGSARWGPRLGRPLPRPALSIPPHSPPQPHPPPAAAAAAPATRRCCSRTRTRTRLAPAAAAAAAPSQPHPPRTAAGRLYPPFASLLGQPPRAEELTSCEDVEGLRGVATAGRASVRRRRKKPTA